MVISKVLIKAVLVYLIVILPGFVLADENQGQAAIGVSENRKAAYGRIELLRDRWGVPHVYSETDAGAMYGLGYAAAEDRAFQMYYNLRIIQGRLAELIGDE